MEYLTHRQFLIAEGCAVKLVNFWFDSAQAHLRLIERLQK
jgi:hypothetical protein